MNELKSIECDSDCGFKVRSHDEKEVMNIAKGHLSHMHQKDLSHDELKQMVKAE
jgi:predicted small metal-binding protein